MLLIDYCKESDGQKNDEQIEIPIAFWKYYDLYRRKIIDIEQFSCLSNIQINELKMCLKYI